MIAETQQIIDVQHKVVLEELSYSVPDFTGIIDKLIGAKLLLMAMDDTAQAQQLISDYVKWLRGL